MNNKWSLSDEIRNVQNTLIYIESDECKRNFTQKFRRNMLKTTTHTFRSLLYLKEIKKPPVMPTQSSLVGRAIEKPLQVYINDTQGHQMQL